MRLFDWELGVVNFNGGSCLFVDERREILYIRARLAAQNIGDICNMSKQGFAPDAFTIITFSFLDRQAYITRGFDAAASNAKKSDSKNRRKIGKRLVHSTKKQRFA
jgi:hypothetical protein